MNEGETEYESLSKTEERQVVFREVVSLERRGWKPGVHLFPYIRAD